MTISALKNNEIGVVYTPREWAGWLIDRGGIYDAWLSGKRVCDPSGGEGVFVLELLRKAKNNDVVILPEMIRKIGYIEMNSVACDTFFSRAKALIGDKAEYLEIHRLDVVLNPPAVRYDILMGNPPWVNFCDLPNLYKKRVKHEFILHGLVPSVKNALLGSSRTDFAALVLNSSMGRLLNPCGEGYFFLPASLFFGDDAHKGWRSFQAGGRQFQTKWLYEFSKTKIFNGIGTSYCAAGFQMDKKQEYPVFCYKEHSRPQAWKSHRLTPLKREDDQWIESRNDVAIESIKITVAKGQTPRQGVNACGVTDVFIFNEKPDFISDQYLFPLVTKERFGVCRSEPDKWILLPYNSKTVKPLSWPVIEESEGLADYLLSHKKRLKSRKGILIQSSIKKGFWWSLLGVGSYSFAPYKVIWQAYGKKDFSPVVLEPYQGKPWQGNQAMNAFIPAWKEDDANRILNELKNPAVEKILRMMNGEGKCNWAQPGKIKKIISFNDSPAVQHSLFKRKN